MTYFGGQGLRLVQGAYVPLEVLGKISIATVLSMMVTRVVEKLGNSVLFPAFSQIQRERPGQLLPQLREARFKVLVISFVPIAAIIIFGREIIELMYDERYRQAGIFLVVSAVGAGIGSVRMPFSMVLISVGDTFGHAIIMFFKAIFGVGGVVIGYFYGGAVGMLVGVVAGQTLQYPFEAWRLQRAGVWMPTFDIVTIVLYLMIGYVSFMYGPFTSLAA
jgi:O-antigen/teichoic acid export membrane protein